MFALLSKWPLVRQIRERNRRHRPGGDVGKNARDARADRRCASGALDLPVLRRRLRAADFSQGRKTDFDRRRSGESPISQGNLCPKGAASYQLLTHRSARNENEISRAARERMDGNSAGSRDGHGGGTRLGIAQTHVRAQARRRRRSITRQRSAISAAPRSTTKKIISSENFSLLAWGWCAYPTRRGYDIAARCPVWAPPLAGAELRPRNKISPTPIAF